MPRKPTAPVPLEIEGLSGKPLPQREPMRCDLTGEVIKPSLPSYPKQGRAIKSAQQVLNKRKAVDRARAEAFLAPLLKPKQVELVPKGWRKIGEWPDGRAILCKIEDPIRRW